MIHLPCKKPIPEGAVRCPHCGAPILQMDLATEADFADAEARIEEHGK